MTSTAFRAPTATARPSWSAALRRQARRVAEAAVTPLELDDVLDVFHPLRRGAPLRGRIVAVRPETADAATIVIKPGADWAGHVPGQYLRIGIDVDGVRHWRAYSLTHGPRRDGLHLDHRQGRARRQGQRLPRAPLQRGHDGPPRAGRRRVRAARDRVGQPTKLLFVTAGSGITPVIGMLRNLFPATDTGVLRLRRSDDLDIVRRPRRAERAHLDLPRRPGRPRRGRRDPPGRALRRHRTGVLDVADLDELVPDLDERRTFACGPAGLLDALEEHHRAAGLDLFVEQFRTARVAPGEGGTVTFEQGGTVVEADGATPILDAAEEAGVLMPSGCRMGICMGCVLPLKEGSVRDLRNGEVTTAVPGETDPRGVLVQTCVSAAAGACAIDH